MYKKYKAYQLRPNRSCYLTNVASTRRRADLGVSLEMHAKVFECSVLTSVDSSAIFFSATQNEIRDLVTNKVVSN